MGTLSVASRSELKTDNSIIDLDRFCAMEAKMSRKMTETVDSLGALIKEQAMKQTKLMGRLADLERKVFGASKTERADSRSKTRNKLNNSGILKENSKDK